MRLIKKDEGSIIEFEYVRPVISCIRLIVPPDFLRAVGRAREFLPSLTYELLEQSTIRIAKRYHPEHHM